MPITQLSWNPFPKQEEFIRLPFSVHHALFGGAAGPGKSEILVLLPILYEFYKFPGFKGMIFRRTKPELESEIVTRTEKYYEATGGLYNKTKMVWTWPEFGSRIQLGYAEHERDIRKYDSAEIQYIAFDELTSFTEFQYTYMFSRSRSTIPGLPAIIRSASNPGNVGHLWVRRRFIEPYRVGTETTVEGGSILLDKKTGITSCYIHARLDDNPALMENDPDYERKLNMISDEADRRAKRYGDWWTFTGQVFDNFRIEPLKGEPDNARHVLQEPYPDLPIWWPRVLAIDWGFSAMLWAGWAAVSPDGRVFVYREYSGKNLDVEVWSREVANLSAGETLSDVVLDWNCFESRGEDQTIAEQFKNFSGLNPRPADKGPGSRISGQKLVKEYLRWKKAPELELAPFSMETAQFILESRGYNAYLKYCKSYEEKPLEEDEIIPKLQIFDCCRELIDVIPVCMYDKEKIEDVAEFDGDDPYDGLRYLLRAVKRLLSSANNEESRQAKILKAKAELERSGDYNKFDWSMKKLVNPSGVIRLRKIRRGRRRYASAGIR